jgi:quinol-cytochrome oxidoreductase complex cytochrome b subunit
MVLPEFPERRNRFAELYDETVRFLKKKIATVDIFDETFAERTNENPWYCAGSMVYLFWMVTIVTGMILTLWYIPNTSRAYDSIIRIKDQVPLGWLVRGLHKYGADAVIIAATMRTYRLYFTGEYKTRELAWALSILTLLVGMFSGLTGYLLIWNQRAFWASKVFATFPTYIDQIPIVGLANIGMTTAQFMLGGTAIGEATMTRFYAGHFALSLVTLIFVEAYFLRKGLRRINLSWVGVAVCLGILLLTSMLMEPELGSRANRAETPLPILSDWYFLGLYQMMKEMKPLYAVIGTMIIPLVALLMPAFDGAKDVSTMKRPFFFTVGLSAFIYWLIMSFMIISDKAQIVTDPPKLWGSFVVFLLCGAVFEFRAMGFPRRRVLTRVIRVWIGWLLVVGIFAYWTRFRQPASAPTYYPPGTYQILVSDDAAVRDEHNGAYQAKGNPPSLGAVVKNSLTHFWVKEWYVINEEQRQKLATAQNGVRGWWFMMSGILFLCSLVSVSSTPPEGIESLIWPTRTTKGKKIKGLPLDDKPVRAA